MSEHPSLAPAMDRPALLAALRARMARLAQGGQPAGDSLPLCAAIDQGLPGGGLPRAALHEVLAADPGGAAGFCALLLARAQGAIQGGSDGEAACSSLLWIAAEPGERPPGLARFGLAPADLVLVRAPCPADGLWAMEEALRCPAVAGALLVLDHAPDPAAARRLQLAAEAGGGIGVLLRPDGGEEGASAASSRWRVAALAGAGSSAHELGDPRWQLDLLRCRGGRPGRWRVVWRAAAERLELDSAEEEEGMVTRPQRPRRPAPRR